MPSESFIITSVSIFSMMKTITFVSVLLFINVYAAQETGETALNPGQVIIEFTSEDSVNLYAYRARKIDVLTELSKYIKIDLFSDSRLDNSITVEIHEQPLEWIFKRLLGEQNFILCYENKLERGNYQLNARPYEIQSGSSVIDSVRSSRGDKADMILKAENNQNHVIEKLEDSGDFKNSISIRQGLRLLNHDNVSQRLTLSESLGDIGSPDAVSLLQYLIKDKSPEVREAAIYSLGDIGSIAAIQILGNAASEANSELRDLAISELVLINTDQSAEALIKLFDLHDIGVQLKLLQAIAEINTPVAQKFLWKMFGSENSIISITAYELLSHN